MKPGRYLVTVNAVSPPRVSQPFAPVSSPGVERREDAVVIEVSQGRVSASEPFAPKRTLPRTTIQAEIVCRDGSLPRSGFLYAKRADDRGYFSESTYERVDGRLRLTVIEGVCLMFTDKCWCLRETQPDERSASRTCKRRLFVSTLTACLPSSTSSRRSIAARKRQSTVHGDKAASSELSLVSGTRFSRYQSRHANSPHRAVRGGQRMATTEFEARRPSRPGVLSDSASSVLGGLPEVSELDQ